MTKRKNIAFKTPGGTFHTSFLNVPIGNENGLKNKHKMRKFQNIMKKYQHVLISIIMLC